MTQTCDDFICPFCLAEELAKYSLKDRRKIWRAAKHLVKFHNLVTQDEELTDEEMIENTIKELEDETTK